MATPLDMTQLLKQVYDPTTSSLKIVPVGYLWIKFTKTYVDFSTAAANVNIVLFNLPAKAFIHAAAMKHTAAFTGGGLSTYTISVGTSTGAYTNLQAAYNVFQAPGDTISQVPNSVLMGPMTANGGSWVNGTPIYARAVASGLLNLATAGSIDFWFLTSSVL